MDTAVCRTGLVALSFMIAVLPGCQRTAKPVAPPTPPSMPRDQPPVRPEAADREGLPKVVEANNALAVAAYHRLRVHPGNLLMSPATLSAGLAVVHAGARGETARQVGRVLRQREGLVHFDRAYAGLIRDLNADGENRAYQIRLANAMWVDAGYPLLESYRETLKNVFALDNNQVDFAGRPDACRAINAWTESHTGGKITRILQPADLPPHTRLVLTSALYFRGNWSKQFRNKSTEDDAFQVSPGQSVVVPMMNDHSYSCQHGYYDGRSFQALELRCGYGEFAMVVLLPRKRDGLADLEAALTPQALESWWPQFKYPAEIFIKFPRFRIRAVLSLKPLLSELGMPLAFDEKADFSGINGRNHDLYLAAAEQTTFLDVHEKGIEASSVMETISVDAFGDEPPVFRADHPFLFLIRDTRSGCIVFMGRVANPLDETYRLPE